MQPHGNHKANTVNMQKKMRMEYKHITKQSSNQKEERTRRRKGQRGNIKTTRKQ